MGGNVRCGCNGRLGDLATCNGGNVRCGCNGRLGDLATCNGRECKVWLQWEALRFSYMQWEGM